jgi:hydroxypyruvate reductase
MSAADQYFAGGHPLPNAASMAAALAALELLRATDASTFVLFLISGGASAMFEVPLSSDISLDELSEWNRLLVGCGAPIAAINCVRKHLSAVKGGRLAAAAPHAAKLSLLISDVPEHALDALASGPTLPDSTTLAECSAILQQYPALASLSTQAMEETPKATDAAFHDAHHVVLLDNAALVESAAASARGMGFHTVIDNSCDDWEYEDAAEYLLKRLRELSKEHPRCCLLSGGEVTVRLPENPGRGGRNQQLALECARHLAHHSPVTVLSAGSDGIDGNSPAAGAVADETTWQRAEELHLNPAVHIANFDAYTLFERLGDAILTGPAGNNLRDLRILLADG